MSERKWLTAFTVMGRPGSFPMDMLRYDGCWPATGEDCAAMELAIKGYDSIEEKRDNRGKLVEIKMLTYSNGGPTIGRWSSFGWGAKVND